MLAAKNDDEDLWEIVAVLLAAKADPNLRDRGGRTALMFAANEGHEQIVARLLAAKADPNLQAKLGQTALMFAAELGNKQIVARLLAAKADPNLKTFTGKWRGLRKGERQRYTALMFAAREDVDVSYGNRPRYGEIVAMLLAAGARPRLRDLDGQQDIRTTDRIRDLVKNAQNRATDNSKTSDVVTQKSNR